ncbi:MAG TPA: VOC family protein [Xanthobacteraceae bacterium]|nr:VOC family protein [Xanthobacteraceae bacterium]
MDKQLSRGVSQLSPHLVVAGAADAIKFYQRAFGAKELIKLEGPDGKVMHACVSINGSSVMLVDENPQWKALGPKSLGGTPVTIHLMVDDVDKAADQAIAAGAKVIMPVADMFWGDRYGIVEDPFGHRWSIATPKRQLSEAELREAARNAFAGTAA